MSRFEPNREPPVRKRTAQRQALVRTAVPTAGSDRPMPSVGSHRGSNRRFESPNAERRFAQPFEAPVRTSQCQASVCTAARTAGSNHPPNAKRRFTPRFEPPVRTAQRHTPSDLAIKPAPGSLAAFVSGDIHCTRLYRTDKIHFTSLIFVPDITDFR